MAEHDNHTHDVRQADSVVRNNPLGLSHAVASRVIDRLNADLASMFVLYHQYHKHHWIVEGAQFLELHLLLEAHYTQLHDQFDIVAERIVALGGLPATGPETITRLAYVQHEAEDMYDLREMLDHDVTIEGTIAASIREHITATHQDGDYGTEDILKEILEATEKRAAFLQKHLQRESLSKRIAVE